MPDSSKGKAETLLLSVSILANQISDYWILASLVFFFFLFFFLKHCRPHLRLNLKCQDLELKKDKSYVGAIFQHEQHEKSETRAHFLLPFRGSFLEIPVLKRISAISENMYKC